MEKHIFHVTSNLSLKKREGTIKAEKVVGKCCKCLFVGVKFQIDEFRCSLTLTFSNLLPYIPVWVTRSRLVTRKDRKDVAESVVKNTLARSDASGGGWKRGRTIASNYVEWPVSGLDSGLVPHSASRVVFVSFGFARRRRRRPAVVASRRLLTLRLGCLWERKYAFRSFLPPSFSRARHPPPSRRGRAESWCTGGQTLVRSARAEENRGMHLRILPGNAAGVRNGAKRLSRKTRLPLELNLSGYVFTLRRCKASLPILPRMVKRKHRVEMKLNDEIYM